MACPHLNYVFTHTTFPLQVSYVLQNAGLTSATSATGATLIGLLVLQNAVSALAPWSASFSEANLRVGA
jgi:hypothetical protein